MSKKTNSSKSKSRTPVSSKPRTPAPSKSTRRGVKPVVWITGLVILLLIVAASSLVLLRPAASSAPAFPDEISVQEAHQKYEQGIFLLDVRTPEEWAEYRAPNTTFIPLDDLESRLNELPKDQEIVVICRSGNRSQQGRDILRKAGFAQTSSVAGGLKEWRAAGYPIVEGP